jgi:adenosylcobinamide hydrolase
MEITHHERTESGQVLPFVVWHPDEPRCVLSTCVVGGGWGTASWILNATVVRGYDRDDPSAHLTELASSIGLDGDGVAMMTAVDVASLQHHADSGVGAWATVGVEAPQWAAAPALDWHLSSARVPGTINIVVDVPASLSPAALANAVATATEAKAQAMAERRLAGTGTPTDSITICSALRSGTAEPYGGPRSVWGSRIARAVHGAVAEGLARGGDRT